MGASLAALVALATAAAATVSVRSNKGIVIPGTDASAELLVVARGVAPDAQLDLTTTAGTVTNVRPLGDGRFQATFTPPRGAPPSIAFVTARVTSGGETELGYAAIALHGSVTVEADAAPKSKVSFEAGGRDLGAFTADASGRVRAQLLVPPRLKEVTLRQDTGDRAVPLELPPTSLLHAAIPGEASHGHGEEPLEIELLTVDRTGYPAFKPTARLSADRGTAERLGPKVPGVFRWGYRAPEAPADGVVKLTARIPDDPASTVTLEVTLRPPRPAAMTSREAPAPAAAPGQAPLALQLSKRQVVSGESGEVMVEILRGGSALTPGEVAAARIETNIGTVIPAAGGVRWVIPPTFGGHSAATIHADLGGAVAEDRVALVPGPPAAGRITFDAEKVRGGRVVGARVKLTDAHHNAVTGAKLTPRASQGEASAAEEEGGGVYRFSYTAPDVTVTETQRLEVAVANGLVVPAPPLTVMPRLAGPGVELGLMVSARSNRGRATSGTPAAELAMRLPSSPIELVIRGDRTFYQETRLALGASGAEQLVSFGGLGGEGGVRAALALPPSLGVHAWIGLAVRHVETTITIRGGPADGATERSSAFSVGLTGAVGFSLRAGPGRFLLEGGYLSMPGQGALRGNLGGLGATAGFLVELL